MAFRLFTVTWTNAGLLSIGPLATNFSEIWIKIQKFSFMKNAFWSVVWRMAAILSRTEYVKSSRSSNTFVHQSTRQAITSADNDLGAKPLYGPLLAHYIIGPLKQISNVNQDWNKFNAWKSIWKYCLQNGSHFVLTSICAQSSPIHTFHNDI